MPLKGRESITSKSPILHTLKRLGVSSSGFKTPTSKNSAYRNENIGINKNKSMNKSINQSGLRENCRSISPMLYKDELSQYEITETLGKGAYGLVKLAIKKQTGEKFAVKIYEKTRINDPIKRNNVNKEINILKKLSHSNTINLIKMIENSDSVYLFTEFVPGSSLYSYLCKQPGKKLSENACKVLFKQTTHTSSN